MNSQIVLQEMDDLLLQDSHKMQVGFYQVPPDAYYCLDIIYLFSFGFYPYTPMCVSTVYSILTRVLWKKKSQAYYSGGIRTQDLCNSRAVSYWVKSADTHRCIWVKKKCKFFIPDANSTSMICSLFVITVTWHFPFFIVTFFNDSSFIFLYLY